MAGEPTPIVDLLNAGLLSINDGYRAKNSELSSTGIPFARAQNINNGFHFEDADRFPEEALASIGNKISAPGDVVFTSKGTVGRFALVRSDTPRFVYAPQLCFWRSLDHKRIDPRWLYYWMHSREFYVQYKGVAGQTDMAEYVSLGDQRRMKITVPDPEEQLAIAGVLGALDDKIEVNRKTARVLEGIARAVFTSWFVDFDAVRRHPHPPHAAASHPGSAAARRAPGPAPLPADLFPTRLVDSPIGEVPEGWRVEPLPEVFEVNPTRSLKKGAAAPYLDMSNMPTQGHAPAEWVQREAGSGMRFINGDTLVARITPCLENGKTAFVDFLAAGEVAWGSTEYIVLRPKPPLPPVFAYLLARDERFRTHAIQAMTGSSGRQRVPAESLDHFQIVVPSKGAEAIAGKFAAVVEPLFARMSVAMQQNRALAALRDALIPKLISGELRTADAEKIVGRTV